MAARKHGSALHSSRADLWPPQLRGRLLYAPSPHGAHPAGLLSQQALCSNAACSDCHIGVTCDRQNGPIPHNGSLPMRSLLIGTVVLSSILASAAFAQEPGGRPHNVVLFVADGLRFRMVDDRTAPTMA